MAHVRAIASDAIRSLLRAGQPVEVAVHDIGECQGIGGIFRPDTAGATGKYVAADAHPQAEQPFAHAHDDNCSGPAALNAG
jgi:hypothetical protein